MRSKVMRCYRHNATHKKTSDTKMFFQQDWKYLSNPVQVSNIFRLQTDETSKPSADSRCHTLTPGHHVPAVLRLLSGFIYLWIFAEIHEQSEGVPTASASIQRMNWEELQCVNLHMNLFCETSTHNLNSWGQMCQWCIKHYFRNMWECVTSHWLQTNIHKDVCRWDDEEMKCSVKRQSNTRFETFRSDKIYFFISPGVIAFLVMVV